MRILSMLRTQARILAAEVGRVNSNLKNKMKTKKRLFRITIFFLIFIICISTLSYLTGYSLVLPTTLGKKVRLNEKVKPGKQLAVFSKFDFSKDKWKAYIIIGHDDFEDLNAGITKGSCLKTTNRDVLEEMKRTWKFKITDGDVGTVESDFYLFQNGKLVFKTGIILSKNGQRLQNEEYGEMVPIDPTAMIKTGKQFKSVYWPVVIL